MAATVTQIAQQPTPSAKFKITCEIDGFVVEVEAEGKADNLRALVERLKTIGAQPLQAKPAAKTGTQSTPICQIHNKAMKPSRKPGTFFCPGRNEDGSYCTEKG
jgi:hypothetical protein